MNLLLFLLQMLLFLSSVFMILLILVQRGKGGGLTGALGGMGGQSAFGAKAGDIFTRITIVTAIGWITLCMVTIAYFNPPPSKDVLGSVKSSSGTIGGADVDEEAIESETDEGSTQPAGEGLDTSPPSASDIDAELERLLSDDREPEVQPDMSTIDREVDGQQEAMDSDLDDSANSGDSNQTDDTDDTDEG